MKRAAWIAILAAVLPVVGFFAGTALFQFWLGLDVARSRFPDATFNWSNVALGSAVVAAWCLVVFARRRELGAAAVVILCAGLVALAGFVFQGGVYQTLGPF